MGGPDRVFFDGECGLCHGAVRFALARDPDGTRFRFAPLGGGTFLRAVSSEVRAVLPVSLVVVTETGTVLTRSRAVVHMMRRIGGGWGALAGILDALPESLLDLGYRGVARVRRSLFPSPETSCPVVPEPLRSRFEE